MDKKPDATASKLERLVSGSGKILINVLFLTFLTATAVIAEQTIYDTGSWHFATGYIFCKWVQFIDSH